MNQMIDPAEDFVGQATAFASQFPGQISFAVDLYKDDLVELKNIRVKETRQGAGSALMQQLTKLADQLGVTIRLHAEPFGDDPLSLSKLKKFYRKFGFKDRKLNWMVRRPEKRNNTMKHAKYIRYGGRLYRKAMRVEDVRELAELTDEEIEKMPEDEALLYFAKLASDIIRIERYLKVRKQMFSTIKSTHGAQALERLRGKVAEAEDVVLMLTEQKGRVNYSKVLKDLKATKPELNDLLEELAEKHTSAPADVIKKYKKEDEPKAWKSKEHLPLVPVKESAFRGAQPLDEVSEMRTLKKIEKVLDRIISLKKYVEVSQQKAASYVRYAGAIYIRVANEELPAINGIEVAEYALASDVLAYNVEATFEDYAEGLASGEATLDDFMDELKWISALLLKAYAAAKFKKHAKDKYGGIVTEENKQAVADALYKEYEKRYGGSGREKVAWDNKPTEPDSHAVIELTKWVETSSEEMTDYLKDVIYPHLLKFVKKGNYSPVEAEKSFFHVATKAAKLYAKEHASKGEWNQIFNAGTRREVAKNLREYFEGSDEWIAATK